MGYILKRGVAVLLAALLLTAIFATPFWLVICFINLEWVNPFASEAGRAALGLGFLIATAVMSVTASEHRYV